MKIPSNRGSAGREDGQEVAEAATSHVIPSLLPRYIALVTVIVN